MTRKVRKRWQEEDFTHKRNWGIWLKLLKRGMFLKKYLLLMGVLALLMPGMHVLFPLLTKMVIDDLLKKPEPGPWELWAVLQLILRIGFGFLVFGFVRLCGRVATKFAHETRRICFEKLQSLSFSFFDQHNTGWLLARLTIDCDRLARMISFRLFDVVWGLIYLIFILVVIFWMDWQLALVVVTVVPPLALASWFFQSRLLRANRHARRINSHITASYSEAIAGVKTTKTLVREKENLHEFKEDTDDMFTYTMRVAKLHAGYMPCVMTLGALGTALALWAGGVKLGMSAGAAGYIGTVVAFMIYARQFFEPIQELAEILVELQAAQAAAERVETLLSTDPDIEDSPEVAARIEQQAASPKPGMALDGMPPKIESMRFDQVTFAYNESQVVLEDLCLDIKPGQSIALVGPTGGGKTTIVSLLCRFYEPSQGRILVNGTDYRDRGLLWWQSQFGIVLQQPQLFSGTVRDNIRFGRLDATDEETEQAARLVCAEKFILEMENGYDTYVGHAGQNLSTGEKQLISFARAIIADPQIFVMDEATSSIDAETESAIQTGLKHILDDRISFIIAHRLSTIRSADLILYIQAGKIVEQGSHHDLIKAGGAYYELYTNQFQQEQADRLFHAP